MHKKTGVNERSGFFCSPHNFKIEPVYKDLSILYDLAVSLESTDIAENLLEHHKN